MPSHYLNQYWNITNWTIGNKLRWNFNRQQYVFILENAFENVVCEMATILYRGGGRFNIIQNKSLWKYRKNKASMLSNVVGEKMGQSDNLSNYMGLGWSTCCIGLTQVSERWKKCKMLFFSIRFHCQNCIIIIMTIIISKLLPSFWCEFQDKSMLRPGSPLWCTKVFWLAIRLNMLVYSCKWIWHWYITATSH